MAHLFLTTEFSQMQNAENSREKLFLLTSYLQEASGFQHWLFYELKVFSANEL